MLAVPAPRTRKAALVLSSLLFMLVALAVAGGVLYWTKTRTDAARSGGDGRHRPGFDGADAPHAAPGAEEFDPGADGAGGDSRQ